MRISYNAPFILTFTFISILVMIVDRLTNGETTRQFFTLYPHMSFLDPLSYVRLCVHVAGHANWTHLVSNFTFILLLGPMLEEKYGTKYLFLMALITAIVTALLNNFLFESGLMGASGIVFMLILLSSFANFRAGTIPLTFILILILFLGQELIKSIQYNNISEFAHIMGGVCGSIFGFVRTEKKK